MFENRATWQGRTAIVAADGATITYRQMAAFGDDLLQPLENRQLVLMMCRNDPTCLMAYYNLWRSDHVVLLVPDTTDEAGLKRIAAAYQPEVMLLPRERFFADKGSYQEVAMPGVGYGALVRRAPSIAGGIGHDASDLHPDLKLLLTTSGSTGSPKFVRLTRSNVASNCQAILDYLPLGPDDRAITTMPPSYSYGLSVLNTHWSCGGSIGVTAANLVSRDFWTFFDALAPTNLNGVPYIYQMLNKLKFFRRPAPQMRFLTQAGGKLSDILAKEFMAGCLDKGWEFFVMYGQTEATARMSYLELTKNFHKLGAIGGAIPRGRFSLQTETGGILAGPGEGELVYEGANVAMGYGTDRRDLAKGDEWQGRLMTGDLASCDVDGYYRIMGRRKSFLKIHGQRINPSEVESRLATAGYECVCAGEDDLLRLYVVAPFDAKQVAKQVTAALGLHHSCFQIQSIDAIPRTATGKVSYSQLAATPKV